MTRLSSLATATVTKMSLLKCIHVFSDIVAVKIVKKERRIINLQYQNGNLLTKL